MKIDRITYSESHEQFSDFGLKLWRKVGLEAELQEGDTPEKALIELKQKVIILLNQTQKIDTEAAIRYVIPEYQIDKTGSVRMEDAINSCTDMSVLVTYKLLVKGKPDLQEIYDRKVVELSK